MCRLLVRIYFPISLNRLANVRCVRRPLLIARRRCLCWDEQGGVHGCDGRICKGGEEGEVAGGVDGGFGESGDEFGGEGEEVEVLILERGNAMIRRVHAFLGYMIVNPEIHCLTSAYLCSPRGGYGESFVCASQRC